MRRKRSFNYLAMTFSDGDIRTVVDGDSEQNDIFFLFLDRSNVAVSRQLLEPPKDKNWKQARGVMLDYSHVYKSTAITA